MLLKSCVAVLITDVENLNFNCFQSPSYARLCIQINWYSHVHLCSVMKLELGTDMGVALYFQYKEVQ